MAREWDESNFTSLYERFICHDAIGPGMRVYHSRYRSRYRACLKRLSEIAPTHPVHVLDIGVGQLALMCAKMWNDSAVVADLPGPHLSYMTSNGVEVVHWNLCKSETPFIGRFDAVFFSEVIEHLPVPGHIILGRLRRALRPGGIIICTTPNLYRLRNVVYMALGLPIYDYFRIPDDDRRLSHVIEYSRNHLEWQLKEAGFVECQVKYCQTHTSPTNPWHRPLAWLGYPLQIVPRWRDNLLATAYAPRDSATGANANS